MQTQQTTRAASSRSYGPLGSNSNAHGKHQNDAHAGDQNGQRRPVVFEPSPISTELIHDRRPLLRAILFSQAPKMARWNGFAWLVAPPWRKVQISWSSGAIPGGMSPAPA
jgi:hypothetical protein